MATLKTVSRNLPFVKQQLGALTSNTSIFFKLISSLTVCCYFLSYSETMVEMLSVTPGYFLPPTFRIYSALTFCFLELHFWELLIDVLTLVCIKYCVQSIHNKPLNRVFDIHVRCKMQRHYDIIHNTCVHKFVDDFVLVVALSTLWHWHLFTFKVFLSFASSDLILIIIYKATFQLKMFVWLSEPYTYIYMIPHTFIIK